jgi:NADPH-dependent ferric siderophore reductase
MAQVDNTLAFTNRKEVQVAGPYQTIKFVMLDFDKSWDRTMLVTGYANIRYAATDSGARLAVVFEGATGTMRTYRYRVAAGQEVFVVDQVIHIPASCQQEQAGNTVKCAK